MESEIIKELKENYSEMQRILEESVLTVKQARYFMSRYFNVLRKMEQLEKSRDLWRKRYESRHLRKSE
jgi:hypothetical protein